MRGSVLGKWRKSPVRALARLAPRVSRPLTAATGAALIVGVAIPTAITITSGALVGAVPSAVEAGPGSPEAGALIFRTGVLIALFVAQQTIAPLLDMCVQLLGRRIDQHLTQRLLRAVMGPAGVPHLEDASVQDDIEKAQGGTTGITPGTAFVALVQMWMVRLVGLSAGILLARFSWWLAVLLIAMPLATLRYWRSRYAATTAAIFDRGQRLRRAGYARELALTPKPAAEVRIFGLGPWLLDRFHSAWDDAMRPVWAEWRAGRLKLAVVLAVPTVLQGFALTYIGWRTIAGEASLALAVVALSAAFSLNNVGATNDNDYMIEQGLAALPVLESIEARFPAPVAGAGLPVPEGAPREGVRFEGISFTYPGRETPVFDGLDLELRAGEATAIVGANGAGKTTLVKLLARLHEPDAGRITVDGVDLTTIDAAAWQRQVATIFQTFARYHLSAAENVGLGAPERVGDREAIVAAARRVGIDDAIEELPSGWDTPLSRQLTGGAELSGGQWQRLALARALFAVHGGARILVLDEPTANLDVRTESDIYERFHDLTKGLTTLVISHRFSTVRRADRIVVIEHGKVVEDGSHVELMALGGRYAEMFDLQASRFRGDDEQLDGDSALDPEEVARA